MFQNIRYQSDIQNEKFKAEKRYILFIAEKSKYMYNFIKEQDKQLYGAIFPQVIFDDTNYDSGCVICEISDSTNITLIENISNDFDVIIEDEIENAKTIFTIVDGSSEDIQLFLENLYETTTPESSIIGGGAGLLTLEQEPVIFSSKGIYKNAALLVYGLKEINLGVQHGWEMLSGPYISTKTEKNILKTINYETAFDLYKKVVEEDSQKIFDNTNFFEIAKEYPLGIHVSNGELVVRDPIVTQNGELVLVGEMDQNSIIYILKGNKKNLINSAGLAIDEAVDNNPNDIETTLVIDCISRVLYLEDDFSQEIKAIKSKVPACQLFGALTLGEIANKGKQYIEFYNKTCVIAVI